MRSMSFHVWTAWGKFQSQHPVVEEHALAQLLACACNLVWSRSRCRSLLFKRRFRCLSFKQPFFVSVTTVPATLSIRCASSRPWPPALPCQARASRHDMSSFEDLGTPKGSRGGSGVLPCFRVSRDALQCLCDNMQCAGASRAYNEGVTSEPGDCEHMPPKRFRNLPPFQTELTFSRRACCYAKCRP